MNEHAVTAALFVVALAVGGVASAALIGLGVGEAIAIVCGWVVFFGLGTYLAAARAARHH